MTAIRRKTAVSVGKEPLVERKTAVSGDLQRERQKEFFFSFFSWFVACSDVVTVNPTSCLYTPRRHGEKVCLNCSGSFIPLHIASRSSHLTLRLLKWVPDAQI